MINEGIGYNELNIFYYDVYELSSIRIDELIKKATVKNTSFNNYNIAELGQDFANVHVFGYPYLNFYNYSIFCGGDIRCIINGVTIDVIDLYVRADNREISFSFEADYVQRFHDRLFNPQVNKLDHSVSLGGMKFIFNNPFQFNFFLLLLMYADKRYLLGYRVYDKAILCPEFSFSEEDRKKYQVNIDANSHNLLIISDAIVEELDDYNDVTAHHEAKVSLYCSNLNPAQPSHLWCTEKVSLRDFRFQNLDKTLCVAFDAWDKDKLIHRGFWSAYNRINGGPLGANEIDNIGVFGKYDKLELLIRKKDSLWSGRRFIFSKARDYYFAGIWFMFAFGLLPLSYLDLNNPFGEIDN